MVNVCPVRDKNSRRVDSGFLRVVQLRRHTFPSSRNAETPQVKMLFNAANFRRTEMLS
jgi:hypothetical protein